MITIIPDIHGRVFWKKAVDSASKDDTIVFLGDYLVVFHRVCPEPVPR